ncbi:hypothetical protein D3C73_21230 [compost metagenome]
MIDALFGSKTRVKLLHLFLNHPGQSFYVREITRTIDEQINSVRRELANMLNVGIITSDSADNKLYYEVNQRYEHYVPLRAIFADQHVEAVADTELATSWHEELKQLSGVRIALTAGVLVKGSTSAVDILLVGDVQPAKLKKVMKDIEKVEGRELNYSLLSYDEFYYRLSVRDKFITEILNGNHAVLVDTDTVLSDQSK